MDRLQVGQADIRRIEELVAPMPMAMFNLSDDQLSAHADWLYPGWADREAGTWDMVVQSWIVEVDSRVFVIDPCVGNGRDLPHFALFDNLDTPFIERFEATGIRPEDVDGVFCTHLHSDHCGWNTVLRDGRFVPTFPNARYFMGRREVERWDYRLPGHKPVPENFGIFGNSVLPVLEAGLAEMVEDGQAIGPGLVAHLAHGHTMGHMALHMQSGADAAWFTGDVFHHPIELLIPDIDAGTCEDFAATVATRTRLTDELARSGALVVPAHFAAPHCGYLRESEGRRGFEAYT
jgi:glyoxylase-like metal-dependent hydrolase (beta-lactamase superfamily II)